MDDTEQHKKMVRLLMGRGADASRKNHSRYLPRDLVANKNQEVGWEIFLASLIQNKIYLLHLNACYKLAALTDNTCKIIQLVRH